MQHKCERTSSSSSEADQCCVVLCLCARKRPRKESDQQSESNDKDVTAAEAPKRRVIKLTSVKELRADVLENTHKGC